jgi:outer membrane lipoprotein-sorting protein
MNCDKSFCTLFNRTLALSRSILTSWSITAARHGYRYWHGAASMLRAALASCGPQLMVNIARPICIFEIAMRPMLFLIALLGVGTVDPISTALAHYRTIDTYQATIRSFRGTQGEIIRYHYQQPGLIRMEFIQPHAGAVLIYKPEKKRAYLWPFGSTRLPPLALSPDNPLIQSPTGQKVDHSDVGSLLENIQALQQDGASEVVGEEPVGKNDSLHIVVTGKSNATLGNVHRYHLWLDSKNGFPVKVVSYDLHNNIIETVVLEDIQINPVFPARFFNP